MVIVLRCSALDIPAVESVVLPRRQLLHHHHLLLEDVGVFKIPMVIVLRCSALAIPAADLAASPHPQQLPPLPSSVDAVESRTPTVTAHRCSAQDIPAVESVALLLAPPPHTPLSAGAAAFNSQMPSVLLIMAPDTLAPESPVSWRHLDPCRQPHLHHRLPRPPPNPRLQPQLLPHPPYRSTLPLIDFTWISV